MATSRRRSRRLSGDRQDRQPSAAPPAANAAPADAPAGGFLRFPVRARMQGRHRHDEAGRDDGRRSQVAGKANIVDVVNAVNQAEITLDTVVAVRDKVVAGLSVHHEHADLTRRTETS